MSAHVADNARVSGRVRVEVYDVHTLRDETGGEWDSLSRAERERLCIGGLVTPNMRSVQSNVTTQNLDEYRVSNLDPFDTANVNASHMAFGIGTTTPQHSNTALNDEVYRTAVTESDQTGGDLDLVTFLDTGEANGNTLTEVGMFTDDAIAGGMLLNHALITSVEKTNMKTVTTTVTLTFTHVP
jgi:hypothetical protein